MLATIDNYEAYRSYINTIPRLSDEEEYSLASKSFYEHCNESAKKLILSNLRFVAHVAYGFKNYGFDMMDLIQEGNVGLMKAVKNFNPDKEVKLITLAVHYIKSEILEFIVRNWSIVKIATTKAQRKLFFNLKKYLNYEKLDYKKIANDLNVEVDDVVLMETRLSNKDCSIYIENEDEEQDFYMDFQSNDDIVENLIEYETSTNFQTILDKFKSTLNEKELYILNHRLLVEDKQSLHDIGKLFNISFQRVGQIEQKVIAKLKSMYQEQLK